MKEIYRDNIIKLMIPFSYIYRALFLINSFFRKRSQFQREQLFVISIGNIHIGGTGKTPIEDLVISNLLAYGFSNEEIVFVSRGYKSKSEEEIFYTKDNSVQQTGDETYMLMEKFSIKAVASKYRKEKLIKFFDIHKESETVKVLVLDDAFQYFGIKRDLDVVVVDVSMVNLKKHGNFTLPATFLREPVSALERANVIVLTRNDNSELSLSNIEFIKDKFASKKIINAHFNLSNIYNPISKESLELKNKRVLLFSAISSNENFFNSLKESIIVEKIGFKDHHSYTKEEIDNIYKKANDLNCDYIVTTEKDFVKIKEFVDNDNNITLAVAGLKTVSNELSKIILERVTKK